MGKPSNQKTDKKYTTNMDVHEVIRSLKRKSTELLNEAGCKNIKELEVKHNKISILAEDLHLSSSSDSDSGDEEECPLQTLLLREMEQPPSWHHSTNLSDTSDEDI